MIQEYLLLNENEKDKISSFDAKGATLKLSQLKGKTGWTVSFFLKGEKEENARKLSEIDLDFQSQFHVTTLENGSAEYMNSRLYPLVSDFERKLRKLLYIISAVHKDNVASKNISDLESKDFGTIFAMLFIDNGFMNEVKDNIKSRQRELFSKADIIAYINSLDENTVWDILLGKGVAPSLRTRFNDVREYRNDVMHSHNIDWKKYKDAMKIYTVINQELDSALTDIIDNQEPAKENTSFNQTLQEVLKAQIQTTSYYELQKQLQEFANLYSITPEFVALQQQAKEATETFKMSPELAKLLEEWKSISASIIPQETSQSLAEAAKSIYTIKADITPALIALQNTLSKLPQIDIPPAIIKLQQSLSSFPLISHDNDGDESKETGKTDYSSNDDGGKE